MNNKSKNLKKEIEKSRKIILDLVSDGSENFTDSQTIMRQKKEIPKVIKKNDDKKGNDKKDNNEKKNKEQKFSVSQNKKNNDSKKVGTKAPLKKDNPVLKIKDKEKRKNELENLLFLSDEEDKLENLKNKKEDVEVKKILEDKNTQKKVEKDKKKEEKKKKEEEKAKEKAKKKEDDKKKKTEKKKKEKIDLDKSAKLFSIPKFDNYYKPLIPVNSNKKVKDLDNKEKIKNDNQGKIQKQKKEVNKPVKLHSKKQVDDIPFHKKIVFYFISVSVLASFVYLSILIAVISFDFNNNISKYLFIPALFTKDGVVEYENYKKIKSQFYLQNPENKNINNEIKIYISKKMIINNLFKKYNLKDISGLNFAILNDFDINNIAMSRIQKIQKIIKQGENFKDIAKKYGDDYGEIILNKNETSSYNFYNNIKDLKNGEFSEILFINGSYYIFEYNNNSSSDYFYNFVSIKAITLELYLEEKINNYKIFSLVD